MLAERTAAYQGVMQARVSEQQEQLEEGEDPSDPDEPDDDYDDESEDDEPELSEEDLLMASIPMEMTSMPAELA